MLSSKIFDDLAQTSRIRNNPDMFLQTKAAAIPLSVMGFAFIYYLINSKHHNVEISTDLLGEQNYNPMFNKTPFVKIVHNKSFKQPINKRLIEYYTIDIWVTNDRNGKSLVTQMITTIQSKLWGVKTNSTLDNNKLKITIKCYMNTYLFDIKNVNNYII
jgi:hypothetical protein